jgi:hypothetical protein
MIASNKLRRSQGIEWPWRPASGSSPPLLVPGWARCQIYVLLAHSSIHPSLHPDLQGFFAFAYSHQGPWLLQPLPSLKSGLNGPYLDSAGWHWHWKVVRTPSPTQRLARAPLMPHSDEQNPDCPTLSPTHFCLQPHCQNQLRVTTLVFLAVGEDVCWHFSC